MRAGRLDRTIYVQRPTTTIGDDGTPSETWSDLTDLRAQLVQSSTEEFQRAHGASTEAAVIFRTRYYPVTLTDRVQYEERFFRIVEIKEIGRRRGLELRCVAVGP